MNGSVRPFAIDKVDSRTFRESSRTNYDELEAQFEKTLALIQSQIQ